MRRIAIGDIHGCAQTFKKLVQKVELEPHDELILLGDMIDRGPDNKGVLDEILRLKEAGFKVILLQGNHEEFMLNAHIDYFIMDRWLNAGGRRTLTDFGATIDQLHTIDPVYWQLLSETQNYYITDHFIFVHAGLNFQLANPLEAVRDLRWIRNWHDEINYQWLGNRTIVHGHTPQSLEKVQQMLLNLPEKQVLNIDTGCVYHKLTDFGYLTAYDTLSNKIISQEYIG